MRCKYIASYESRVRTLYRVLSKIYGLMDLIVFPNKKANPRKGLANQIPDEQVRVLDVCCGTGNSTIAIGKKNINNTVIGIDLSRDMLKVARNKAIKNKIANTSFIEIMQLNWIFQVAALILLLFHLHFMKCPKN